MRDRNMVFQGACAIVACGLGLAASAALATEPSPCTYFVRAGFVPQGGTADGLTPDAAFPTITAGARAIRSGGEVVCVGPGLYLEGDVSPLVDGFPGIPGSPGFPVVIRADATGASTDDAPGSVQMRPPTGLPANATPTTAFLLIGRRNVLIDGFDIADYADAGIQARAAAGSANSADLDIRNNIIRNCRTGIDIHAEGTVSIDDNTIGNSGSSGISVESCTAISISGACRGVVSGVVVPKVTNNSSTGGGAHGLFLRIGDEALVQGNTLSNNRFSGLTMRGVSDAVVSDNVVHSNTDEGISIGGGFMDPEATGDEVEATARNATVRRNDIRGCRIGIDIHGEGMIIVEDNTAIGGTSTGISIESCSSVSTSGICQPSEDHLVVPIVSNNRSGGNGAHGIFLRIGEDAVVQNNVVFSNLAGGITLRGIVGSMIANNLIYRNGQEGVAIGTGFVDPNVSLDPAYYRSPNAVVLNNTIYENSDWGIEAGSSGVPSPGTAVINNIVWRNGGSLKGIGILNERDAAVAVREPSVCSYVTGFNDVLDDYGPDTPRNNYDLRADPLFVDIGGLDGVLGGEIVDGQFIDRSADDDFRLAVGSPARDAGSALTSLLGVTGSATADRVTDEGRIDIGYHYDAEPSQVLFYDIPFMPLYVRQGGDDTLDGLSVATAFATIQTAALRARAGVTVVVGPGTYNECDIHPPPDSGRVAFLADPAGEQTGDPAGVVFVDASKCIFDPVAQTYRAGQTGFSVSNACGVVIDGFHVTGALDDGIQLQNECDGGIVRNNVVFANRKRGINVVNSDDVRIANNLALANGGGIQTGSGSRAGSQCATSGARRSILEFNTLYGSTEDGILIGAGVCPSTGAQLRYNVTAGNGKGLEVGNNTTVTQNLVGYVSHYNLFADRLGAGVPIMPGDLPIDLTRQPLYLAPTVIDVSGDWRNDTHFRLAQTSTGQAAQSPAVDGSDITALMAGLSTRSTRSDGVADAGAVDRGYHYPTDGRAAAGDCDGDGKTAVNELILAVNVALANAPLTACSAADVDGDGTVSIADLLLAVNAVLGS
ncbi:MAG: right-handed parallel beta-helix repeat-containing protein [bacterium]